MRIRKGDWVGHLDGFIGTALTDEAKGSVQVRHESGVVSTWAAGDTRIISRPSPSPVTSTPATSDRQRPKRAAAGKSKAKRPASKKGAKKPTRKKGTSKKVKKPVSPEKVD
jgi:hypothetical protein